MAPRVRFVCASKRAALRRHRGWRLPMVCSLSFSPPLPLSVSHFSPPSTSSPLFGTGVSMSTRASSSMSTRASRSVSKQPGIFKILEPPGLKPAACPPARGTQAGRQTPFVPIRGSSVSSFFFPLSSTRSAFRCSSLGKQTSRAGHTTRRRPSLGLRTPAPSGQPPRPHRTWPKIWKV